MERDLLEKQEKMKNISKIFLGIMVVLMFTTSCENFLDPDSDQIEILDGTQLQSPSDTLYTMIGIFNQLENLAERYVILGELRGDLMSITEDASSDIREVYNFNISEDNQYNAKDDYYMVINQCNYLITTIDTSIVSMGENVMYEEFAAAKAIRAWTYMQLALNYKTVKYYDNAILTIADAEAVEQQADLTLEDIAPDLINDLLPWVDVEKPWEQYSGIYPYFGSDINTEDMFLPIRMILGDLYLWTGDYESAARAYYELIIKEEYTLDDFNLTWEVNGGEFIDIEEYNWLEIFSLTTNNEKIGVIAGSTENGKGNNLDSIIFYDPEVTVSDVAIQYWDEQTYYYTNTISKSGDLRKELSYISNDGLVFSSTLQDGTIYKFTSGTSSDDVAKSITVYRVAQLYLRYAEAVNRAGKPNLAFAVLKNGLNSTTLAVDTIVPPSEKYTDTLGTFVDYVDFTDNFLDDITAGVHGRGCGNTNLAKSYDIPKTLGSTQDSIEWVEDQIITELALEMAFEGNRFHDLMRVALRRNDPSYLAEKVNAKYSSGAAPVDLTVEDNWYLK